MAALGLATPALARITAFQHIILVIQENRTPDNMFQGLCRPTPTNPTPCSTQPGPGQYNIKTSRWLDKISPKGYTDPHANPFGLGYDMNHAVPAFRAMCDADSNGVCAMDGAALVTCEPKAQQCPPKAAYGFIDNSASAGKPLQPYLDIVHAYGWGNYMFQTDQSASYASHQFLFGATSAPTAADDHSGTFVMGTTGRFSGCTAPSTAAALLINWQGLQSGRVFPCFEHRTVGDLLNARGVSWRYYGEDVAGAWRDSTGSGTWIAPASIKHICVAVGQKCTGKEWTRHLEFAPSKILSDISTDCKLRGVSWVIPDSFDSDHSWDTRTTGGPSWVASIVNAVENSPCKNPDNSSYWESTAIIIMWDDWGGWYDHEPPRIEPKPQGGFQLGFRVPLIVVSAYTPANTISNLSEDFGSVVRFVERNFGIMEGALTFADARGTGDLTEFFNLGNPPRLPQTINAPLSAKYFLARKPSGVPVDTDD
jgi:phospholipase C